MSANITDSTCRVCKRAFSYPTPRTDAEIAAVSAKFPDLVVDVCGKLACRARALWTPSEWSGRARMADARRVAGVPLDDLDLEALERHAV